MHGMSVLQAALWEFLVWLEFVWLIFKEQPKRINNFMRPYCEKYPVGSLAIPGRVLPREPPRVWGCVKQRINIGITTKLAFARPKQNKR